MEKNYSKIEKKTNVWFTSDQHYGHSNIIRFCNRPFNDVHEMNESLIKNHNSVVKTDDIVYYLGDFGFMDVDKLKNILVRLNGQKILIYGNHDKVIKGAVGAFKSLFLHMTDYLEINVYGNKIILCHYPMLSWNGSGRGSIMLHGHSHGTSEYGNLKNSKILDVGVDCHNYAPISAKEIFSKMSKRMSEDFRHNKKNKKDENNYF